MLTTLLVVAVAVTLVTGQSASDGTIVLSRNGVRSNTHTSGIVEVYYGGEWSGICNDGSFGQDEADVVCHQLGYESADSYSSTADQSYGSPSSIDYSQVDCLDSNYLVLFQCDVTINTTSCQNNDAITVTCSTTSLSDSPFSGQVRLTGGDYTSEGLVEVYCNDEWGTICDDFFDTDDANVICDQLGYNNAVSFSNVNQGTVDQPIWYQNPGCFGTESCLTSCTSCGDTNYLGICTHSEDVSVRCEYDRASFSSLSTTETCDFTDLINAIRNLVGIIVGVVIGVIVLIAICIAIPIIICCCCVGGAACCAGAAIAKA